MKMNSFDEINILKEDDENFLKLKSMIILKRDPESMLRLARMYEE